MVSVWEKMKLFSQKSYDDKLQVAMNIINNLKDRGNVQAQQIFDKISIMDNVPEKFLDAIYQDFCDSVDRIEQEKFQKDLHRFDKAGAYLKKLKEEESMIRSWENPDDLLAWLDDL